MATKNVKSRAKKIATALALEMQARAAGKTPCRAASDSVLAALYDENSDHIARSVLDETLREKAYRGLGIPDPFAKYDRAVASAVEDQERDTLAFLDLCRRNLGANAWLPKTFQRKLFDELEIERGRHTKTRDELGAEVVRVRRAYNEVCRRFEEMDRQIVALRKRLVKFTKASTKGIASHGYRLGRR